MIIGVTELTTIPLPNNVNTRKFEEAINQAEQLQVKQLLGNEFFTDLTINKANANYQDLLNGKNYVYSAKTYSFKGLNPVISNYTYANYLLSANFIDTASGVVLKRSENSNHSDYEKIKNQSNRYISAAISYWEDVKDFLCRNSTLYPLYEADKENKPDSTFEIITIRQDDTF